MGDLFNFAPEGAHSPVSAESRKNLALELRRLCRNFTLSDLATRRVVSYAQNYLAHTNDYAESIIVGVRQAVVEENRGSKLPSAAWGERIGSVALAWATRFVWICLFLAGATVVYELVLRLAQSQGLVP